RIVYYVPTALVAVGVLALWEFLVRLFQVEQFILPRPTQIYAEFRSEVVLLLDPSASSILFESTWATLFASVGGYVIGCGAGILVAMLTARFIVLREATMPFAIAANSVPIVAFAPIMNNWFGLTNPLSKMAIVSIIVFFPAMINTVRGLTLIDQQELQLMHSYAATPLQILLKLRIPSALPYVFSALRVASALAVIGAVVGEFFGGPRATLGVFITQEAAAFDFARAWAAIVMASLIGIGFYTVVVITERVLVPWRTVE
ncbi:MAG: ABC transporter permease, partial [Chloroflexota bacterium]